MANWEAIHQARIGWAAKKTGSPYTVTRPNYASQASTESAVSGCDKYFRIEPGARRHARDPISGASYFEIFGRNRGLAPGDVFTITTSDVIHPIVTLLSFSRLEPIVGVLTNKLGRITDGSDVNASLIYSNIHFDLLDIPTVGQGLDEKITATIGIGIRKATMYFRAGILPGMWLRWDESDYMGGTMSHAFRIDVVDTKQPFMVLNLSDKE